MGEAICLFNLPREIWRSRIIPRLSVEDACRLDSALLNHILRPSLLEVFVDAKLEKETVVSLDIIDWITSRKIQPLRIKLIEDITGEDLSMFLDYCTELVSLNTWDFQVDAQVALKKSRQNDDNTLTYDGEFCEFSEEFVIAILKSSTHLKSLSICDMSLLQWFRMFPNIVHLCGNMEEINFRERQEAEREGAELTEYDEFEYSCFYLSRTSLHMVSNEIIPSALLAAVGAHFSTLTSVSILTTSMNAYIDKGLLSLAAHCPALERAALGEAYSHGTIVEFCRRRPNLTELRLIGDLTFFPETLQRALQLLPELRVFACNNQNDALIRAVADAAGRGLRVLGVAAVSVATKESWEYVLQKCTKLRTIQSAAGCGSAEIRSLARKYGVRIEKAPLEEFTGSL